MANNTPAASRAHETDSPTRMATRLERTRTGTIWITVILFVLILLALVIFIAQNSQEVKISFLGSHGHLGLAVAMLISAIAGALLVILAGGARILQLRHTAQRNHKNHN